MQSDCTLSSNSLLTEAFESYAKMNRRMTSPQTAKVYRIAIKQLGDAIGHAPTLADLSDDNLIVLEKHLAGRSKYTINERTGRLKALWRWLAKRRYVDDWPSVDRLPVPEPERRAWTVDQVRSILKACEQMTPTRHFEGQYAGVLASRWWYVWHLVQWETGERTGAMLALTWDMLTDRGLAVPGSCRKAGKSAFYLLTGETMRRLQDFRQPERERLFPWPSSIATFYNHYRRLLKIAGLPHDRKCKPQRMRRSHLTHWAAGGGDPTARAQHSSAGLTTRFYLDETQLPAPSPSDFLPEL